MSTPWEKLCGYSNSLDCCRYGIGDACHAVRAKAKTWRSKATPAVLAANLVAALVLIALVMFVVRRIG